VAGNLARSRLSAGSSRARTTLQMGQAA